MNTRWMIGSVVVCLLVLLGTGHARAQDMIDPEQPDRVMLPIYETGGEEIVEFGEVAYLETFYEDAAVPDETAEFVVAANATTEVRNGDFAQGTAFWNYYDPACIRLTTEEADGNRWAQVEVLQRCGNMQIYQTGILLQESVTYELSFRAASNSGHDLTMYMQRHDAPYTIYGLGQKCDLPAAGPEGMTQCTFMFSGANVSGSTTNTRLRFWFAGDGEAGDVYYIDDVQLGVRSGTPPFDDGEDPSLGNLIRNPRFVNSTSSWHAFDTRCMNFYLEGTPSGHGAVGRIDFTGDCSNMQVYQSGIQLEPATKYELRLWAAGFNERWPGMRVYIHNHEWPYNNYMADPPHLEVMADSDGDNYRTYEFTTPNLNAMHNARLRLWFVGFAEPGDTIVIDDFVLIKIP